MPGNNGRRLIMTRGPLSQQFTGSEWWMLTVTAIGYREIAGVFTCAAPQWRGRMWSWHVWQFVGRAAGCFVCVAIHRHGRRVFACVALHWRGRHVSLHVWQFIGSADGSLQMWQYIGRDERSLHVRSSPVKPSGLYMCGDLSVRPRDLWTVQQHNSITASQHNSSIA